MSRLKTAALCATLLASACKVERTPPEYIDHRQPIATTRDAAAEELHDRLLAMGQALDRGDPDEALQALAPAADAYLIAADRPGVRTGEGEIAGVLREFAARPDPVRLREVEVSVGPRANVAWFRALLDGGGAEAAPLRFSGVYLRGDEGEWRLVQGHLSSPTPPTGSPPADSLAPSRVSAAAPPGAG